MDKLRLLIIDDEPDICELIADVAEARGFDVKTVTDPTAVEAALGEFKPHALMMDLMMPGTDGVELLRNLGEAIKGKAVVLMSGHDQRVLGSAKRLGAAHGINVVATQEKPLEIEALRKTLDSLSAARGVEQEKQNSVDEELDFSGLTVYYQPIIDMATCRVKGCEALVRWQHPQAGIIGPDNFLPRLDEAGMMKLTNIVMAMAVRDAATLQGKGFALSISINMTVSTLLDLAVPDKLEELCKQHGVSPEKINIEVTEGEAMREVRKVIEVLTRFRLRGFGLAIDDFGTGYSSLRELQRLPFGVMKMDKSFVLDMADNRDSQVITHAIIDLGHALALKIVAEGIESARVWNLLKDRRCDMAQGFFISKPLPLSELLKWLDGNKGQFVL